MKAFLLLVAAALVAIAAALWTGIFNVSALVPHWGITSEIIEFARDRSVEVHSRDVRIPSLDDPKLAARGASQYHETCRICHGAPGVAAEVIAQGLYPAPADLLSGESQKELGDKQLFWIIENGLKMTGMPAFGTTYQKNELIEIAAFVKHLPAMTPQQYRAATSNSGQNTQEHNNSGSP
jgi:mono/diheme cytochrome c family protein